MEIYWSLLVCLVGLVMYLILANPPSQSILQQKGSTVGLHMFWVGLLVFLFTFAGTNTAHFLRR